MTFSVMCKQIESLSNEHLMIEDESSIIVNRGKTIMATINSKWLQKENFKHEFSAQLKTQVEKALNTEIDVLSTEVSEERINIALDPIEEAKFRPKTDINGLFLTGGEITLDQASHIEAIRSGILTAGAILERNTLNDLQELFDSHK